MEKTFYIIPGWEDTCNDKAYQNLARIARGRGYEVVCKNIDWKKPLSAQIFEVPENAVIFGFSIGALLGWLVAQKYSCQHLILASMTPHYSFTDAEIKKSLEDLVGSDFVDDLIQNLNATHQAKRQTVMYGDQEEEEADILVGNTEHELTDNYIEEIAKIL